MIRACPNTPCGLPITLKNVGSVPSPWKKAGWTFWQHSQKGTVPGVIDEVDLNVFNRTLDDLKAFVADSRID